MAEMSGFFATSVSFFCLPVPFSQETPFLHIPAFFPATDFFPLPRRIRDFHPLERAYGAQTKRAEFARIPLQYRLRTYLFDILVSCNNAPETAYALFFAFFASSALSVGFTITSAIINERMYNANVAYNTY